MTDIELQTPAPITIEVHSLPDELNQALAGKAAATHTHPMIGVSGLQSALDSKDAMIDGAISTHLAAGNPHPNYASVIELATHSADSTLHLPSGGITNTQIATGAAIAWSKVSKSGALPADVGAAAATHTHTADQISGLTAGSQFPKTVTELNYTFSQSSDNPAGTYAILTDGSQTTGAGTTNEGTAIAWLKADLGSLHHIEHLRLGGGVFAGWSSTTAYWDNVTIEVSSDDTNWMQLFAPNAAITSDTTIKRFFAGYVPARYVRLRRTGYLALAELRIFGFTP